MYAKIFEQIYDSSIAEDYQVRHVFMDLLVLADQTGVVDMTVEAVARRTNVPIEIIRKSLLTLSTPDPDSRSKEEDGRRIVPLDDRGWGWQIVNFAGYHKIKNESARREYMKDYMRKRRAKKATVKQALTPVNPLDANVKHVDVDVDTNVDKDKTNSAVEDTAFDVLWKAWPGKKGAGKAKLRMKWKVDKLDSKAEHVMAVLAAMKKTEQWRKEHGKFIPMLSTWLNQQRWDCDIADITVAPKRKTVDQILAEGGR